MFPEPNLLNIQTILTMKSELTVKCGNCGYQFIANTNWCGGRRRDDNVKFWSENCVGIRDDATLLPLPCLVLNPNAHILASLIFYPGHAVLSRTTLFVFHMFMFLLNMHPPFQTFPLHPYVSFELSTIMTLERGKNPNKQM